MGKNLLLLALARKMIILNAEPQVNRAKPQYSKEKAILWRREPSSVIDESFCVDFSNSEKKVQSVKLPFLAVRTWKILNKRIPGREAYIFR